MVKVKNDLTGQRFGRLAVLCQSENDYVNPKGKHYAKYWVQCDCGSEKFEVPNFNLKSGNIKSCGCLFIDISKEKARKMGLNNRKHFGCKECGSDKHYAKGFCRNCYLKAKRLAAKQIIY